MTDKQYFESLEKGTDRQRACFMIIESIMDAPHHGLWYLDQALRILAGDEYGQLIETFESYYGEKWDAGIAP